MLTKKEIIAIVISVLFTLSAVFSGISSEYNSKADEKLLFSLIEFERANYITNHELVNLLLVNYGSLRENKEYAMRSWTCSFALLYKDSANADQNLFRGMAEQCLLDLDNLKYYQESQLSGMNKTIELSELYKSIKPLEELSSNLEDYIYYSKLSTRNKYVGWLFFFMGFLIFYIYFLKYLFKNKTNAKFQTYDLLKK